MMAEPISMWGVVAMYALLAIPLGIILWARCRCWVRQR